MVEEVEFVQGLVSPCLYFHKARGLRSFTHDGDFVTVGQRSQQAWFKAELGKHMMMKDRGTLGPDQRPGPDLREGRTLN